MSSERFIEISKQTVVPVSLTLLFALVLGVWTLAWRVYQWETRLATIETRLGEGWSYLMEREVWRDVKSKNPDFQPPDVSEIHRIYVGR